MNRKRFKSRVAALLLLAACFLIQPLPVHGNSETADETTPTSAATPVSAATLTLIGQVANTQGANVDEAQVRVFIGSDRQTLTVAGEETDVAHTHPDGSFIIDLTLPRALIETGTLAVEISKPGYRTTRQSFTWQEIAQSGDRYYARRCSFFTWSTCTFSTRHPARS